MREYRHAVAYVIHGDSKSRILVVKRPDDDKDLPGAWGLPAGSVGDDESDHQAILRSGRQKLGVELKVKHFLGEDEINRGDYFLHLREYGAEIINGTPKVPQHIKGITQYAELKWGAAQDLRDAAAKGSLCSRIYLRSLGLSW